MKKLFFCLAILLTVMLVVSCQGGGEPTDTTVSTDTEVLTDAFESTENETTENDTTEKETTDMETTDMETTEKPFDPLAFEPAELPLANVAREGYALASACMRSDGYSNLNLNDGDRSTGFSTPWNSNINPKKEYYFYIDLTTPYKVDSVKLYPMEGDEKGFPKDFDILTSMDGVNYSVAATVTNASAAAAKEGFLVPLNGVEARFVKLVTHELGRYENSKGRYLSLSEFEVYAPIDTASNMILNRNDIWLYKNPDTTQQLSILYYRDGTAVDPDTKLKFATMDASVATVDENGLITPVGVGETDVYVTDGTNLAVCHVEVKDEVRNELRTSTFYHSNFAYPEQIPVGLKVLADAGIEYIEDTRSIDRAGNYISMYTLFVCNELGLAYSPSDPAGGHSFLESSDEEILAVVKKYENRAGFFGIYLADEPHEEYMEFAEVFHLIQEYNPHLIPHLNLLPPYNFGGVDEYFTEFAAVAGGNGRMRYLSYDHYAFRWDGSFDVQVYSSLNRLRNAGLHYNADTGYYLQSVGITNSLREMSDTDLLYNASLGLAYGFKNYKWFVALTPVGTNESFTTGLVAPDFTPSSMHAGVSVANRYVKNMGMLLANSDAIEVYHTNEEADNLVLPTDFIFAHMDGGDAIYTLYESLDGARRQHVVITNKSFTTTADAIFKIKLQMNVGELSVFDPLTGETSTITVGADGTFTLTLKPGQCVAIILPEGVDASRPNSDPNKNLALNKPVFASSSAAAFWEDGNIATYFLTDGIVGNGNWRPHTRDRAPWLKLDLLEVTSVSTIKIHMNESLTSGQRCKSFHVLVSEDGVNYVEVAKVQGHNWSDLSTPLELTFDKVSARYIRIVSDSGRATGFGDIEVYG